MDLIQSIITDFIEQQLNDNTKGTRFVIGSYKKVVRGKFEFKEPDMTIPWRKNIVEYNPAVISDFAGDYDGLPNERLVEYVLPLTVYTKTTAGSAFNDNIDALNQLSIEINGNAGNDGLPYEFKDSTDTIVARGVFVTSDITPASQQESFGDSLRMPLEMKLFLTLGGPTVLFGNDIIHKLAKLPDNVDDNLTLTTIYPSQSIVAKNKNRDGTQALTKEKTTSTVINTAYVNEMTLLLTKDDDILQHLLLAANDDESPQNQVYRYEFSINGIEDTTITKYVTLETEQPYILGNEIVGTFTMLVADKGLYSIVPLEV